MVAHQGEVGVVRQVARIGLQAAEAPFLPDVPPQFSFRTGQAGRLAREGEVRRRVVSVDEKLLLGIDGDRLGHMRIERFTPVHEATLSLRVFLPFRPRYRRGAVVRLLAPLHVEVMPKGEGVSVDLARLGEDDRFAVIEAVVPCELLAEGRKPFRREIRVEHQPWHGGFDELDRQVPGVDPVQRLHLAPGSILLGCNRDLKTLQESRHRLVGPDHREAESKPRADPGGAPAILAVRPDGPHKRNQRADEAECHQPSIADLLAACGIGLSLKFLDFGNQRAVCRDVNAGTIRQLIELLARQRGEFLAKLVPVARKRLVDVLDQKNVPLA